MAWQMGNPLSQTLFISFYFDRMLWPEPKTLDQARFDRDNHAASGNEMVHVVLRAYCLGVVKSCDLVHRTISSELYYEVSRSTETPTIAAGLFTIFLQLAELKLGRRFRHKHLSPESTHGYSFH